MGIPRWRGPDDEQVVKTKLNDLWQPQQPLSLDRVRSARIRRRPSIHGLRNRARTQQRERYAALGSSENGSRASSRYPSDMPRSLRDGIPPISTLLETAEPEVPPPPPPYPMIRTGRGMGALPRPTNAADWSTPDMSDGGRRGERQRLIAVTNHIVNTLLSDGDDSDGRDETRSRRPSQVERSRPEQSVANLENIDSIVSLHPAPDSTSQSSTDDSYRQFARDWHASHSSRTSVVTRSNLVASPDDLRVDGLGDRDRSPVDEWETMRATIAPDTTLPSADSSFTSAAASQSFSRSDSSSNSTADAITQTTSITSLSHNERNHDDDNDSLSSATTDDLYVADESLAYDMYFKEMSTPEGRVRIAEQEAVRDREGNRFALRAETAAVDIGFRLIEAAVERVEAMQAETDPSNRATADLLRLADISQRNRRRRRRRLRLLEPRAQSQAVAVITSPPLEMESSHEAPIAHPVGAPATVSGADIVLSSSTADPLLADLGSGEQDLNTMQRIVERLASRDDVPDEWWMSMGLNLSRTRPRRLRHSDNGSIRDSRVEAELNRTRAGRVDRPRDRNVDHDGQRGSRL